MYCIREPLRKRGRDGPVQSLTHPLPFCIPFVCIYLLCAFSPVPLPAWGETITSSTLCFFCLSHTIKQYSGDLKIISWVISVPHLGDNRHPHRQHHEVAGAFQNVRKGVNEEIVKRQGGWLLICIHLQVCKDWRKLESIDYKWLEWTWKQSYRAKVIPGAGLDPGEGCMSRCKITSSLLQRS